MLQRQRRSRDGSSTEDDNRRMPKRKHQPDGHRAFSILHQLACHVVYRGDVIRICCMPQAETISYERSPQKDGIVTENNCRPEPCTEIKNLQDRIDADDSTPETTNSIAK